MTSHSILTAAQNSSQAIQQDVSRALSGIDFSSWDEMLRGVFPGISAESIAKGAADGSLNLSPSELFEALISMALSGLRQMLPFAAVILGLAFVGCILERMQANFSQGETAGAAGTLCFLLTALPVIGYFSQQLKLCMEGVRRLTAFSDAAMPSLLALLTATGGISSAAMLKPAAIAATGLINTIIEGMVTTLVSFCAALAVVGGLSSPIKTGKMLLAVKTICTWVLTAALSIFASVITVQGLGSSAMDGVSIRAVQYAIDNYVPVVGGFFKDSYGMLVGSALILRNAVGITGLIWIILLCCMPLLSLMVSIMLFKICAALIEPLGGERMAAMLSDFSGIFSLLFAVLASVAMMCIILIAAVIACGNTVMGLM
ncbi:MAG: stage III sporulation protein AE [Christensenellales bacterium]|jgi:stage III sporulation protein AE